MAARYGQLEVLSFLCKMGIVLDAQDKVSLKLILYMYILWWLYIYFCDHGYLIK